MADNKIIIVLIIIAIAVFSNNKKEEITFCSPGNQPAKLYARQTAYCDAQGKVPSFQETGDGCEMICVEDLR